MRHRITALFFLSSLLFMAKEASAQVNIERYNLEQADREGWSGAVDGNIVYSRGNVDLVDLGASLMIRHQILVEKETAAEGKEPPPKRLENRVMFLLEERRATLGGNPYINRFFSHVRWTRMWFPRVGTELFTQAQFNEFVLLQLRSLVGLNMRFHAIDLDGFTVSFGTGYMPEYERFNLPPDGSTYDKTRFNHRWNNYLSIAVEPGDGQVILHHTSYVQPRLDRFQDIHMLHSTAMSVVLTDHLSLTLALDITQDTEPPPTIEALDIRLKPGLTLRF
ncbi:MAG: DUF481 domain-containing protein [Myxococcota bacterium]|nr:DUF481 domain-containing protein [Myxococcota bacterium]